MKYCPSNADYIFEDKNIEAINSVNSTEIHTLKFVNKY